MKKDIFYKWFEEGSIAIPKLLMSNYGKLGMNETEFVLVLHLHTFIEGGNRFPTPVDLGKRMTISEQNCMNLIRSLLQKGLLSIGEEKDQLGIKSEYYSLHPLWEKLIHFLASTQQEKTEERKEENTTNLYLIFEKEFGRPLSPFEVETLGMWEEQDQHSIELIQAALREAVMVGKLNFRYIDRILFEWKRAGVKNVEQAVQRGQQFRQNQRQIPSSVQKEKKIEEIPFYNWLEEK